MERVWKGPRKARKCYVCKKQFEDGDLYYESVKSDYFKARHTTCARTLTKSRQEIDGNTERVTSRPEASPTGRRRRAGGHGYSGGDGFTDRFQ
jgi:hypothetical protein